jgi:hypothetical protein
MSVLAQLKAFDAYPKLNEDFRVKTFGGAISQSHGPPTSSWAAAAAPCTLS